MRNKGFILFFAILLITSCTSCTSKIDDNIKEFNVTYEDGGLLFAHMTSSDYGRLYYSISKDGIVWKRLNKGKRITEDFE